MNAEQLLTHFDRLVEAPDAIRRLRRFILDLAVRGKLLEQVCEDKPSDQQINKSADANKRFAEVEQNEPPYHLPKSWKWVQLGDRLRMANGRAFKPTDWLPNGLRIVRIQNLNNENAPFNFCDEDAVEERHLIDSGDFLISWSGTPGTSFGAFIWQRGRAALNQHIFKCFQVGNAYFDRFLQIAINGRLDEMIAKAHGGVGLQHITKGKLENLLLSLPPLPEQHRIVAKVDELMALCDRLEAAQAQRERRRDRLAAASLNRLNRPDDDAKAFHTHARFHLCHLARFTVRPDQIPALRQSILNLAVRGRLVAQDMRDSPAVDWLRTVVGSIRTTVLEFGEPPFPLPESWMWLRVADVFEVAGGIQKTPSRAPRENAFPYLGVGNVYRGYLDLTTVKKFELEPGEIERRRLESGDLLVIEGNGSLNEIGRCAKWNDEIENCVHQNHVIRCRPRDIKIASFVLLFLNSPTGMEIMKRLAITSSGLYSLSVGKIRQIEIPIPPLAEQRRIVAKVDELMAVCHRLESQLATAQAERRRLLEALLNEALHRPLE